MKGSRVGSITLAITAVATTLLNELVPQVSISEQSIAIIVSVFVAWSGIGAYVGKTKRDLKIKEQEIEASIAKSIGQ